MLALQPSNTHALYSFASRGLLRVVWGGRLESSREKETPGTGRLGQNISRSVLCSKVLLESVRGGVRERKGNGAAGAAINRGWFACRFYEYVSYLSSLLWVCGGGIGIGMGEVEALSSCSFLLLKCAKHLLGSVTVSVCWGRGHSPTNHGQSPFMSHVWNMLVLGCCWFV